MRYPEFIVKESKWNGMTIKEARAYLMTINIRLTDTTIRRRIADDLLDYYITEDNKVMVIDNGKLEKQKKARPRYVFKKQEQIDKLLNNENDAFIRSDIF
jgi:hypothetical protein